MTAPPRLPPLERYRPLSTRRRLLIVLLAVATALSVAWMLLERPGAPPLTRPKAASGGEIGGKSDAFLVPAAAPRASGP